MNITRNREDAEDCDARCFPQVLRTLKDSRKTRAFTPGWCASRRIEALMRLRKRRPTNSFSDEPVEAEKIFMPRELEIGPSPEQRFAQRKLHEILSQVIDKLEPDFRVVFVMRDVEELSTEETAKALGI